MDHHDSQRRQMITIGDEYALDAMFMLIDSVINNVDSWDDDEWPDRDPGNLDAQDALPALRPLLRWGRVSRLRKIV